MRGIDQGLVFGLLSLSLYIVGGISTFAGLGMIVALKGKDLMGLGDGSTLGYLFVCVGLCVSVAAVLMMRVLRNRHLA
ncbi:MAG: hypothetical protein C0624_06610 [Desulfuromonas sp.]|nr:MAG: hypothetical protein C0624_06610 [Desulfuromonas sp.]